MESNENGRDSTFVSRRDTLCGTVGATGVDAAAAAEAVRSPKMQLAISNIRLDKKRSQAAHQALGCEMEAPTVWT